MKMDDNMKQFVLHNTTGPQPDFQIKLGDHVWKVHSALFEAQSGYFRAIINGEWKEGKEKVVTLTEGHPWDILRMLQFMYSGDYDYHPDVETEGTFCLLDLMSASKTTEGDIEFQKESRRANDYQEIDHAMLEIADYFDILGLRESAAGKLVGLLFDSYTPFATHLWMHDTFRIDFRDLLESLRAYFADSPVMEMLESDMVDLLLQRKMAILQEGWVPSQNRLVEILRNQEDDVGKNEQDFHRYIQTHAEQNISFALKIAKGLERRLNIAIYNVDWTLDAVEILQC